MHIINIRLLKCIKQESSIIYPFSRMLFSQTRILHKKLTVYVYIAQETWACISKFLRIVKKLKKMPHAKCILVGSPESV